MSKSAISIPAKWEKFLKQLADDHQVNLNSVIIELCAWAFSNPETKKQFDAWLDDAFPAKGESEDKERSANEEISDNEEDKQDESEEEAHEDRDYSEDREVPP
jgi:hypothetical protein